MPSTALGHQSSPSVAGPPEFERGDEHRTGVRVAARLVAPIRRELAAAWREPLLRNGHFLTVSSVATAAIGLFYWSLAAHHYSTAVVGRSSAVIAAMMMIGGVAQLNLISALIRFVPVAGVRTGRLVVTSYVVAAALAGALGIAFVAVAPLLSGDFRFVTAQPLMAVGLVVSSAAWAVFVLQDSVLTGLRLAPLVAMENAAFSLIKVIAVVALATVLLGNGIVVSWWIGLVVAVAGTNLYLFRWALRRRGRLAETDAAVSVRMVARFAGPDYVGGLCWLAVTAGTPLVVLASVGASETAYFAIAWQFAIALFALSANMGASLMVETASDQADLAQRWRRVVNHSLLPLGAAVAVIEVGAPYILRVFGAAYARHTTGLLRLLALAAIPNLVTETAVFALRSQRRTAAGAGVLAVLSVTMLGLTVLLLPTIGILGVGVACLEAEVVVAVALLARKAWWLPACEPARVWGGLAGWIRRCSLRGLAGGPRRGAPSGVPWGVPAGVQPGARSSVPWGTPSAALTSGVSSSDTQWGAEGSGSAPPGPAWGVNSSPGPWGVDPSGADHSAADRSSGPSAANPFDTMSGPDLSGEPAGGTPFFLGATIGLMVLGACLLVVGGARHRGSIVLSSVLFSALSTVPLVLLYRANRRPGRHDNGALPAEEPAPGAQQAAERATKQGPKPAPVHGQQAGASVPIENYDDLRVDEVLPLLQELNVRQLEAVQAYEATGCGRRSVLDRIQLLAARADGPLPLVAEERQFPIGDYDALRVVDILPLLDGLAPEELDAIAWREESGAGRVTILKRIDRLQARIARTGSQRNSLS